MQMQIHVTGMTCGHCEKAVTQAIRRLDPEAQIQIDRSQNQVKVNSQRTQAVLEQAIREEGYGVITLHSGHTAAQ